jgi:hypothetical protein
LIDQGAIRLFAALTAGAFAAGAVGAGAAEAATVGSGPLAQAAQGAPSGPTALTGAAAPISPQSATVQGTIDPGGAETTFLFQYGTTTRYQFASASQDAGAGTEPEAVSATLSGLRFGTLYHYRILASNALGQATGEDHTFRTPDAILSGRYAVTLKVLRGAAAFGERSGQVVHRPYRFTARCRQGLCQTVSLRRRGAGGTFLSKLRRHQGDRYKGMERSGGLCNDGERFRSTTAVLIYPTSLSGSRAAGIAGTVRIGVRGCVNGTEVAELTGGLGGRG